MKFDIIFVTYNSEKWINNCIKSILQSDYNLKNISLFFYDNNSSDNTITEIEILKENLKDKFNKIILIKGKKNKGFGYGNNIASAYGNSEYLFFLNIDTEIRRDTLSKLENGINLSQDNVAMWELCQAPYEHPKYYNPVNGETSWASGACMTVKRKIFEQLGGFDENIFMYCEDVDLSWNFRKHGYLIKYLFNNYINHYSYNDETKEFKQNQFIYCFINNWYLRAKYGNFKNYLRGLLYVISEGFKGSNIPSIVSREQRKIVMRIIRRNLFIKFIPNTCLNIFNYFTRKKYNFTPIFINGLDYELTRNCAFYIKPKISSSPLVSILVRTYNRKNALRENLISLRNQTYENIEIIVVEDGNNSAESMIKKEFSDLNINYFCPGKKVGRSQAGNIAMQLAKGKYLNFLDDDDVFYPNHVETLVCSLESNNYDVVYSTSFETKIDILSNNPYKYLIREKGLFDEGKFSKFSLYKKNLFPIQTVMFSKKIVSEIGNLDTKIDALEDWDFWVRMSLKHNFYYIPVTTSIFRTPYNRDNSKDRSKFLTSSLHYLHNKFKTYHPEITVDDWYEWRNNK